jgi:phage-related protein
LPFINGTVIPMFWRVVDWVITNWPLIRDKVLDTFNTIVGWVQSTLLPFINGTVIPLFWSVVNWVETNWPKIAAIIEGVWGFLVSAYNTVLKPVIDFIIERFQFVVGWVQENWPLIQKTIATIFSWFQGDGKEGWSTYAHEIETIFNFIKTIITQAMNIIFGIIKLAMQLITGDISGAGETLKKIFADIFWGALNIVATVVNLISEVIAGALVGIIDFIGGAGSARKLLGDKIFDKADMLKSLGITQDGLYATLGINTAPTTDPKTNVINGMGTNGGLVVNNYITTRDDPEAIALASAREIRLQQAANYT